MKNLILNLIIKFAPDIIVKVYEDYLKEKLRDLVQDTKNDIDDKLVDAVDNFISNLKKK